VDPVTLIVTALTAGAAAGLKDSAAGAVKSAYEGLKSLVAKRFTGRPGADVILARHEEAPETWKEPLTAELVATDAAQDSAMVRLAQELLALMEPEAAANGKLSLAIQGDVQGVVQGDHNDVSMTFGSPGAKATGES
jgi:hypothetical protein